MSLEAEREMWEAIASQPAPAVELETYGSLEELERANESQTWSARPVVCDRCGRELGTGLPSPCSRCATG